MNDFKLRLEDMWWLSADLVPIPETRRRLSCWEYTANCGGSLDLHASPVQSSHCENSSTWCVAWRECTDLWRNAGRGTFESHRRSCPACTSPSALRSPWEGCNFEMDKKIRSNKQSPIMIDVLTATSWQINTHTHNCIQRLSNHGQTDRHTNIHTNVQTSTRIYGGIILAYLHEFDIMK